MILRRFVQQLSQVQLLNKQVYQFGRPFRLKVNKFSGGALQQKKQEQEIEQDEDINYQELEDPDFDKSKQKQNKFKYMDEEDLKDLQNDKFDISQFAESADQVVLESFQNPDHDPTKVNTIKKFKNQSDDEEQEEESQLKLSKEEDKQFTKEQVQFIKETLMYEGEDPYYEKLVNRPEKGVVWGLGGQLLKQQKNFFEKGKYPSPEAVISFLELEQAKDIICVDLEKECNRYDLPRFGIILSSFSCRHNYRIAQNLLRAIRELEIPDMKDKNFKISGRKDDEWLMVDFNDIQVHCFVEESREEIDLEWKWKNPPSKEEMAEFEKIQNHKSRKTFFEPLDDY
ncbi:hypothetical protein ABPG74_000670 [Tetrahymena malaccensis]